MSKTALITGASGGIGYELALLFAKDGFDCMSCAWPDPPERKLAEFCENGAKAVGWEADPLKVPSTFWEENDVESLAQRSEYWLGQQGRTCS